MAKLYVSLTPEEVRASIPYDLICMVRYGCTWNTGRRRRAWQLDFTEDEKKAAGRLFRQSFEWTCGRGLSGTIRMTSTSSSLIRSLLTRRMKPASPSTCGASSASSAHPYERSEDHD